MTLVEPSPLHVIVQTAMSHEAAVACTIRAAADACPVTYRDGDRVMTSDAAAWYRGDRPVEVRSASLRQIRRLFTHAHTYAARVRVAALGSHRVMVIAPNPHTATTRVWDRLAPVADLRRDLVGYYNAALADVEHMQRPGDRLMRMVVAEDVANSRNLLADVARLGFNAAIHQIRPNADNPMRDYYAWAKTGFRTTVTFAAATEVAAAYETSSILRPPFLAHTSDEHGAFRLLLTRDEVATR